MAKTKTNYMAYVVNQLNRKSETAIFERNRDLFSSAAALICELRDRLFVAERDRASIAEILKETSGCFYCKHCSSATFDEGHAPCAACIAAENRPAWEWKGK